MNLEGSLRAGIVGAGIMGRWHAHAAAQAGARVAAVFDPDRARAEQLATRYAGCRPFADLRQFLDAIDLVHICTPSTTHVALAREVLEAGRHALVEKPLAPRVAETMELLDTAASHGVFLCPVHQFVFQDGMRQALADVARIGPLRHVDITICSAGSEGADGATRARIAREILPHPLSILQRVLPMGVASLDWTVYSPIDGEIRAVSLSGDITVSLLLSMTGRPTTNGLRLVGAHGTTAVDLFHGFAVTHGGAVSRRHKVTQPFTQAGATSFAAGANLLRRALGREPAYPGLRRLVDDFYRAVSQGGACPIEPDETLAVARACEHLLVCAS